MNNFVQFVFYVSDVSAIKLEVNYHFFCNTLGSIVYDIEIEK